MLTSIAYIIVGVLIGAGVMYEIKCQTIKKLQRKRIENFRLSADDHLSQDSEFVLTSLRTINEGLRVLQSQSK